MLELLKVKKHINDWLEKVKWMKLGMGYGHVVPSTTVLKRWWFKDVRQALKVVVDNDADGQTTLTYGLVRHGNQRRCKSGRRHGVQWEGSYAVTPHGKGLALATRKLRVANASPFLWRSAHKRRRRRWVWLLGSVQPTVLQGHSFLTRHQAAKLRQIYPVSEATMRKRFYDHCNVGFTPTATVRILLSVYTVFQRRKPPNFWQ